MSRKLVLVSAGAVVSVFAVGGVVSHIPRFTAEYTVQKDGSIHLPRRGVVTPADLSKEYTVGDVVEMDGQPSAGGVGVVDGSNTTFTLSYYPLGPAAVNLFLNGLYQSLGTDYTLNGKVITFNAPPQVGDRVRVAYRGEFSQ